MIWLVIITAYDDNFTTLLMSCYFENLATLNIVLALDNIQRSKGRLYVNVYIIQLANGKQLRLRSFLFVFYTQYFRNLPMSSSDRS